MARQIFIGLLAEGSTDQLFFKSIIERTFNLIKFECDTDIDIYDVEPIPALKSVSFTEKVLAASQDGLKNFGMTILCVHSDAGTENSLDAYNNLINPALSELENQKEEAYCKMIVALVPIQEMEAWMLADTDLLKREIGTTKTDNELLINRPPETIANPKEVIEEAIRISRSDVTKRRRNSLTIAELYLPIGESLDLKRLDALSSYQDFKNNIRTVFKKLKLLR